MKWSSSSPPKTCLFVQANHPDCRYVVMERQESSPLLLGGGTLELGQQSLAEELRDQMAAQKLRVRQVVLLLPRSELEVASLNLPPATDLELPELIQGALLRDQEEGTGSRACDFLVTHQDDESTEVTVFSLEESELNRWKSEFKAAGFQLIGVTFSGLGTAEILPSVLSDVSSANVIVTIGDQDLDLVVSSGNRPVLFRTIPWSPEEDHHLSERLGEEIPRTLSLVHRLGEEESPRIYLVGDLGEYGSQYQALTESIANPVTLIDPQDLIQSREILTQPSRYGNLIGLALAWNRNGISLNLLVPRRPAAAAGPWRKYGLAAAGAAVLLLFLGSQILGERSTQLEEVRQRQEKLDKLAKRANKSREIQALAAAVTDWRHDEIAWIDELRVLAEQLPPAEQALIRKMNLSIDAQRQGVIDLSVQVSTPEVVTLLEDALRTGDRSVSSKRVSESDEKSKLPWAFDTRVIFAPPELPDLSIPEDALPKAAEKNTDQTPDSEDSQSSGGRPS